MGNAAIIEKVRKLRALATSTNAHEAASAAAAADRLIQEHRLQEAELHAEAPETAVSGGALYTDKGNARWRAILAFRLTRHYGVYALAFATPEGKTIRMWGTPSDIELVKYMYAWLTAEADRLVGKAVTRGPLGIETPVRGRTARNSWFRGFVDGVYNQLVASKVETETTAKAAGRGAGLVHLATALARAKHLALAGGIKVSNTRAPAVRIDATAYGAGKVAGANVHLGKGLAARPGRLLGTG